MLGTFVLGMCISYIVQAAFSTRLPLEVFELTAAGITGSDGSVLKANKCLEYSATTDVERRRYPHLSTSTLPTSLFPIFCHHQQQQQPQPQSQSQPEQSHHHQQPQQEPQPQQLEESFVNKKDVNTNQPLDRRRSSRQMFNILKGPHNLLLMSDDAIASKTAIKAGTSATAAAPKLSWTVQFTHKLMHSFAGHQQQQQHRMRNIQVLYQVGDSEMDLPVCAPNEVCSKIDLYETPWIERQCRCPSYAKDGGVFSVPEIVIYHHHGSSNPDNSNHNHNNEKYLNYESNYDTHSKLIHQGKQRVLLAADFNDAKFDSYHLKKLMDKHGAVYEDDLHITNEDYNPSSPNHKYDNNSNKRNNNNSNIDNRNDNNNIYNGHNYNNLKHIEEGMNLALPSFYIQDDLHKNNNNNDNNNNNNKGDNYLRHSSAGESAIAAGHEGLPWAREERELATPNHIGGCPSGLGTEDGHTIADKTRHYKLCQPVHRLPICRHFRDFTWTLITSSETNITQQIVHCRCPKNSVTYLMKRDRLENAANGYRYLFACSPLTRLRCQRKQPCKLFTVRKRQQLVYEVNINTLCRCPKGHHCPVHHTEGGVIAGQSFLEDNIQTYSGYCMIND